jgi:hypothetical protein
MTSTTAAGIKLLGHDQERGQVDSFRDSTFSMRHTGEDLDNSFCRPTPKVEEKTSLGRGEKENLGEN